MDEQNPTTGDSGASTLDRLEKYLAAEVSPAPEKQEATQEAEAPEKQAAPEKTEKTETPKEGEQTESQQPQLSTTDLAKILGIDESAIDVDDDGNISVKTKIDGKEGAAKFTDLVKSYQLQGHAENRARVVAEQEKALQARQHEVESHFQQKLNQAEQLSNIAAQELLREYQNVDWKALDQHPDQGAVAALKMKFQERRQQLQGAFDGIQGQRAQLGRQAETQQAQRLAAEAERIPTLIPEWKDQAVAAKQSSEIKEWGLKVGYTAQELASLDKSSALHVATVRKAMLWDQQQQAKPSVENRVRIAPKIVKPGQSGTSGPEQRARDLKQSVIKSGGKGDSVANWLLATGKV